MQKMKPILFNTEMIKAILSGRKTETRRPIKPCNKFASSEWHQGYGLWINGYGDNEAPGKMKDYSVSSCWLDITWFADKYIGKVDDVLYVRETFRISSAWQGSYDGYEIEYKDGSKVRCEGLPLKAVSKNWTPSIHMPKGVARIFLKITNVRVERCADITAEGLLKEGFNYNPGVATPKANFSLEWSKIYGNGGPYGWHSNPYVWVIEFERCDKYGAVYA